jgi:hypothetical protein
MANAAASTDSCNARDRARAQSVVEATLRKARAGIVCRRTWPDAQALARLEAQRADPRVRRPDWLDSTLDLRDGLSVVEVFTASPQTQALLASLAMA